MSLHRIYSPLADVCLHVHGGGDHPDDYSNVDIAKCDGSDRQKWSLSSQGEIVHLPSGLFHDIERKRHDAPCREVPGRGPE